MSPAQMILSLVLALFSASLFLSAGILWHRMRIARREARLRELRRGWTPLVLDHLAGDRPAAEVAAAVTRRDRRIFADFVLDLAESLDGEDIERLRGLLDACGIVERALVEIESHDRHRAVDAILLVGRVHETRAAPVLRDVLAGTTHEDVAFAAASALAALGDPRDVRPVLERLVRAPHRSEQSIAQVVLEFGLGAGAELESLLRSADVPPRAEAIAIELTGVLQDLSGLGEVVRRILPGPQEIRRRAIRAAGRLGSLDSLPALLEATNDANEELRLEAVTALRRVGADEVVPALRRLLEDPAASVRHAAARALLETGARGRAIVEAFSDRPDGDAAKSSVRNALAEWNGEGPGVAA